MITIDDLQKIELKVVTVTAAESVEGSEKLLRLQVDGGEEQRQIVSGIAKSYRPEELIGKQVVLVANLEPRTIFGIESNGMLLAANGEAGPVVLTPEQPVSPGASIQ
jgi:methionyl-tRNA synthetase